jgi:1-acyl-sn-glycerol-3-phosphate acyltransferase
MKIKRTFNIFIFIYVVGTICGLYICLLEVFGRIRFNSYARLPFWEGKLILASNHPGWLDVVIIPMLYFPWWFREILVGIKELSLWPLKIIKQESNSDIFTKYFKDIPVSTADKHNLRHFGWFLEGWNIFINRREGEVRERSSALKSAVDILNNNGRIVIFPGGGRDFKAEENGDGIYDIKTRQLILRRPKRGIGWVVKRTGATIVPIRLEGTDKVLPNKANERLLPFLRFERYILRIWSPIVIRVGKPLKFPIGTKVEVVLEKYIEAQIELFQEGAHYIKT